MATDWVAVEVTIGRGAPGDGHHNGDALRRLRCRVLSGPWTAGGA